MGRKNQKKKVHFLQYWYQIDYNLLMAIFFLLFFGLVMLYSMSYHTAIMEGKEGTSYLMGQLRNIGIGLVVMFLAAAFSRHWYGRWSMQFYWISFLLLLYVELNGEVLNGAKRWIRIAGIQFQPNELSKITSILFVAFLICKYRDKLTERACLVKVLGVAVVSFFSVLVFTDNLSTAIIIAGICVAMLLVALPNGESWMYGMLLVCGIFYAIVRIVTTIWLHLQTTNFENSDFRLERVIIWVDPERFAYGKGLQTVQGLYALGAGGLFGKGLGNGTQKLDVIPEVQNDMILSAIAEELGIFGVLLVLALYGLLLYRLYVIANNAPDKFGALIVAGIFIHLSLQIILNIGVVTNLIPNTGVTLPFLSYGGTAVIVLLGEMGIALGISNNTNYGTKRSS